MLGTARRVALVAISLFVGCSGDAPSTGGSSSGGGTGAGTCDGDAECGEGAKCVDDACVQEDAVCAPNRPYGLCSRGNVCVDGDCVDQGAVCSSQNPAGKCMSGAVCLDGSCVGEGQLCSDDNPTGFCESGRVCHGGECEEPSSGVGGTSTGGGTGNSGGSGASSGGSENTGGENTGGENTGGENTGGVSGGSGGTSGGSGGEAGTSGGTGGTSGGTGGTSGGSGGEAGTSGGTGGTSGGTGGTSGGSGGEAGTAGSGGTSGGSGGEAGTSGGSGGTSGGSGGTSGGSGGTSGGSGGTSGGSGGTSGGSWGDCGESELGADTQGPTASFVLTAVSATSALLDASASYDDRSAPSSLQYRWDFDADDAWDTEFSSNAVAAYAYPSSGKHTARVEVRDEAGNSTVVTRSGSTATATFVTGNISTTTWSGVIVLSGNTTVPAGQTLTIAPGTQVLATYSQATSPEQAGDGSVSLTVVGTLDAQGTAADPIVFSMYQAAHRHPRAWVGIAQSTSGSVTLKHATAEYAIYGIRTCTNGATTIEDATFQLNGRGAAFGAPALSTSSCTAATTENVTRINAIRNQDVGLLAARGNLNLASSLLSHNGGIGISVANTTSGIAATTVAHNGGGGIEASSFTTATVVNSVVRDNTSFGYRSVYGGSHSLQYSTFERNDFGIVLTGCPQFTATGLEVRHQRKEALVIAEAQACPGSIVPSVTFQGNNVRNSSTCGGAVLATGLNFGAILNNDQTWSTPGAELIDWVEMYYYNVTSSTAKVYLRDNDGLLIAERGYYSSSGDNSYFYQVDPFSTPSVELEVRVASASWMLQQVAYRSSSAPVSAVLALRHKGAVSLSGNYWGGGDPLVLLGQYQGAVDASGVLASPVIGAGAP